jgi:hypothetical protein
MGLAEIIMIAIKKKVTGFRLQVSGSHVSPLTFDAFTIHPVRLASSGRAFTIHHSPKNLRAKLPRRSYII